MNRSGQLFRIKGTAVSVAMLLMVSVAAQDAKLYNPDADAAAHLSALMERASAEKKFILIQGGGNWCKWCLEFARFCKADRQIDSLINRHFIWYHLNSSKENENRPVFARLGYPQRFGFPVFVIMNEKGERLHTQNSEYLEEGKSYNREKIIAFLEMWTPEALAPARYEKK